VSTRVVHVASGREWRGGQRQVWLLARELERLGDVAQVVVTGSGTELARRLRADGITVREAPWRLGLDPRVCGTIYAALGESQALLHAHDGHSVILAGVCATLSGQPLIATRRVPFHLRRRGYWGRAARVIAISQAVASVLAEDGIPPERINVVHSGIALDQARATKPAGVRSRLGLPPNAQIAASVASLEPEKDHGTLLRAAQALKQRQPKLHWVVAGDGSERLALEQLRDDLGLHDRVHFLGRLEDPTGLIADANLFIMSSREEGLGTSVLDAMALGIPVASTSAGGIPEMLHDDAGLLVPPGNHVALAGAVSQILDDSALRRSLIENAKAAVLCFSADRMAAAVRDVYRSCAHLLDGL
jgi:glycosyltransferase involved in cell wall biosynthesis